MSLEILLWENEHISLKWEIKRRKQKKQDIVIRKKNSGKRYFTYIMQFEHTKKVNGYFMQH